MLGAQLDAEDVAWQVETHDLSAPIGEQADGAHRPRHHFVDKVGPVARGEDLLITGQAPGDPDESQLAGAAAADRLGAWDAGIVEGKELSRHDRQSTGKTDQAY